MLKLKATKKEMKENYDKIISVGYCNLAYLLKYEDEYAYSTRAEGWACDYYDVNGVLISTGYAPIPSRNTHADYETMTKYNELAEKIALDYGKTWEEKKSEIRTLLETFVREVA